jgi:hypothetical protein
LCETLFSHAGADGAEELEQAPAAEQVEVGGVDVVRIVELGALLAGTGPVVFDAGQAFSVEVCCAVGAGPGATCVLVCNDKGGECCDAYEEPGGGEGVPEEREPGGGEGCGCQAEAGCREVVEDFI